MKRLLLLGFFLGLAGTLSAAYFTPWVDYKRYRTAASVLTNGGRVEQFVVHLPADRIGVPIDAPSGTRLEHFKLRDTSGNVIGIAARHQTTPTESAGTAWLLAIPSRGTLALTGDAPSVAAIEAMLAARGLTAGQAAEPELSIDAGEPARSVTTTGEFTGIDFELVETWVVTGLENDGQLRGTLRLNTVGRQS